MPRAAREPVNPTPRRKTSLNVRQERFALEYLVDFDPGAAYLRAGYGAKDAETAASAGRRLLRNVRVRDLIDRENLKVLDRAGVTAEATVLRLHLCYLEAMRTGQLAVAVSALKELGKHFGIFQKHQRAKRYTQDDVERLRAELTAAGFDFRRAALVGLNGAFAKSPDARDGDHTPSHVPNCRPY